MPNNDKDTTFDMFVYAPSFYDSESIQKNHMTSFEAYYPSNKPFRELKNLPENHVEEFQLSLEHGPNQFEER